MSEVWKCPPLRLPDDRILRGMEQILAEISEIDLLPHGPVGVAGLELRTTLVLFQKKVAISKADNDFWRAKCNALFIRPAIEPIVCSFWGDLLELNFDQAKAARIVSALTGGKGLIREGESKGYSGGKELIFEDQHVAAQWLSKLKVNKSEAHSNLTAPVFGFTQVIMSHPFCDGNGRFARVMIHAALGRALGLDRPIISLSPSVYRHAERIRHALSRLNMTRDWNPIFEVFTSVLQDAFQLTRAYLDIERTV